VKAKRIEAEGAAKHEQELRRKIAQAVESVSELTHPMILIPGDAFINQITVPEIGRLQLSFRTTGQVKLLESMQEVRELKAEGGVIIFFSYECLQYGRVAPNEVQL